MENDYIFILGGKGSSVSPMTEFARTPTFSGVFLSINSRFTFWIADAHFFRLNDNHYLKSERLELERYYECGCGSQVE